MKTTQIMINEYISRFYRDKENFKIRAYHTTSQYGMYDIFNYGYIDPTAKHKGECPYDIIWFSIKNDDYDGPFRFSYEIDQNTFEEMDFKWMNDIHLSTPNRIDVMDKRLRIEKINGVSIDNVFKRFYDGTKYGFDNFIEKVFELSDYELSNELFVMKILQQYGFKRSDYFMDDESQEMNESINMNNVVYYGVFLDETSKEKLMELLPNEYYKAFCDHMTIAFKNNFTPEVVEYCESNIGKTYEMVATHIGISEDVVAVKVETDCKSTNKNKHITLCTLHTGAKPVQSNYISDWKKLESPILLSGIVKAFPSSVTEKKKRKQGVEQGIMMNAAMGDMGMVGCMGESVSLNEVESEDISLKSFEVQDELNPKFWVNNKINSRVRLKLLDLADEFYDSLNIKWVKPKDIVLTGSIANYNWSKYSDVDVHILVDYKDIWSKTDFVKDYFDSKKQLWSEEHEGLKIYGFPVEMYVEDTNNKNPNSGIYSLEKNKWIVEPNDFQDAKLNEERIKDISAKLMTEIDDVEEKLKREKDNHKLEKLSTRMKKLFDKLVKQRKESLEKHGELGTYNIVWKVLRRTNYLDKMWDIINTIYNKVNSIKENVERKPILKEAAKDEFSYEELSSIDDYRKAIEYCWKNIGEYIGVGSSRAVFQIDDEKVLKLAMNDYGIQQNMVEYENRHNNLPLFPNIFEQYCDKDYKYIVAEYVLSATNEDVMQCLGFDTETFFHVIQLMGESKHDKSVYAEIEEYIENDKSDTLMEIFDYVRTNYTAVGDMRSLGNWGLALRNGKEHMVLLDAGWDKVTKKMYGFTVSS